jgi:allantoinase
MEGRKMSADLFLKNAQVVTEQEVFHGGVALIGEKISQVVRGDQPIEAAVVLDLAGKVLLPGMVDAHVHFNEPGRDHWEGYRTGTMAAAAGGVTSILEMPLNSIPATTNRDALALKRQAVAGEAVIDYGNWGGLVDNNLSDLDEMNQDGVIGYKAFASASGVEFERLNDDLIYAGLLRMRDLGNVIGLHAENEWVCSYLSKQFKAAGRTDRAAWYESRPPFAELECVQRASYWAKVTGGNLHIVHVSIPDGIRAIADAKQAGANVTAETCPHYLFFDHADYERIGPAAKCAPPIRSSESREVLWACVLDGLVDTIGSDHSPCNWEEKEKGMDNIWKAWGGISGVQLTLPVMLSEGVNKRGLPLPGLARMLAYNPARLFGLSPQKGSIKEGADADLVVVDLDKEWTLTADQLFYKNKFSAYVGSSFKGQVLRTFVRGKTVYQDGQILAEPGYGKLLRRTSAYSYL